jgi:hypothetical protein
LVSRTTPAALGGDLDGIGWDRRTIVATMIGRIGVMTGTGVEGSDAAAAMGPTVVAKETAAGAMVATNISDMAVTTTSGARRAHLSTVATGAPLATAPGARRRCSL